MYLIKWGYLKRDRIKALFDTHPSSPVIFGKVNQFYFIYRVHWHQSDPIVPTGDLGQMERLMNEELGSLKAYLNRKSLQK